MALFGSGGPSTNQQPQMYGVPGGMYIAPQQQANQHNMMKGPHMQTGPYHQQQHMMPMQMQQQQRLMHHAPPQQQQAQVGEK